MFPTPFSALVRIKRVCAINLIGMRKRTECRAITLPELVARWRGVLEFRQDRQVLPGSLYFFFLPSRMSVHQPDITGHPLLFDTMSCGGPSTVIPFLFFFSGSYDVVSYSYYHAAPEGSNKNPTDQTARLPEPPCM